MANELNRIKKRMETVTKRVCKQITQMKLKELKHAFNQVKRRAVRAWYSSYQPKYYARKLDLYKIPHFDIEGETVSIEFDENNMTKWHRVSNQYIYENSFVKGYHGGADDFKAKKPKPFYDAPHPDPGVPYWRRPQEAPWPPRQVSPDFDPALDPTPYKYRYWGAKAARSTSAYDMIKSMFDEEVQIITDKYQEIANEMVLKALAPFVNEILEVVGGDN